MTHRVAVVHPMLCAECDLSLHVKQQSSWSGNDFHILDAASGALLLKVEGKALSSTDEMILEDATGTPIAHMRRPVMKGWTPRMNVEGPGYSFKVIQKMKFASSEAKAEVTNLLTHESLTLYMYGNWSARRIQIYVGKKKEAGRLLAYCERPHTWSWYDKYELTVLQGTDIALCVVLCMAFQAFFNQND